MNHCVLIHYHELSLKKGNRKWFEDRFVSNVTKQLKGLPFSNVKLIVGRVVVFDINPEYKNLYLARLKNVMGLMNATTMVQIDADIEQMRQTADYLLENVEFKNFRVTTKRQDKSFPKTSIQISMDVGGFIHQKMNKPVKLKGAELELIIEIVNGFAYIGFEKTKGFGGLPVGVSEKAISLLSSGIDSPVSSFELLKRGVNLTYVHFHSAPATSRQSIKLVERIVQKLTNYSLNARLYHIPLLEVQQAIMEQIPNKFWILFFRRSMMKLASQIAELENASALITGENIGQVASQTLSNIRVADDASTFPILRPLAGSNKDDIVNRAKEIGTYEISIEPYQDCCSYFVPVHPETRANLDEMLDLEAELNIEEEMCDAFDLRELKIYEYNIENL
ncbi:MAG: tRNA 4-thiouridine(8) synthase ThiI [Candidatus Marinimicrobia bacterium]|nr:tRNA 4-thiouridine(8) synthase ThiI [Candidatus Neomarinimicrobiota bacterium]